MATGIETTPSPDKPVVLDFPVNETASCSASSPRIPSRLKKRLLESKSPSTVEEIEAKLRHADLRRQQFYEKLSSKARAKPRSPLHSSSNEDDLGQRLEAKLQAAEQKRLDILMKAQMRLAKLDELRQAAKTGLEMRFKREREMLGTKVQKRVQQAEANRMLLLKAKQRSATLKERMSQSSLRRLARESKYKERVRAAILQKRAAAEKKRLEFLEAEKKRVQARVLQVLQAANSASHQREIERQKMRDRLENRLQRAKRQRAEYLRLRARQHDSTRLNSNNTQKQADLLSIKLARCWRRFLRSRRTTLNLAKEYDNLKINENSIKEMPFDQLAHLIESPATLQAVKNLLDRLESRFKAFKAVYSPSSSSGAENIDHLLKRVSTPKKRVSSRNSSRNREAKKAVSTIRQTAMGPAKLSRYPVRIVLCAYMIVSHPDAVFNGQGEREIALAKSAGEFIKQFELLMRIILDRSIESSDEESDSMSPKRCTFRSQLEAFDKAWCLYLNCFVVWKVKDAQILEEDLVRAACQLELSMIQKCKLSPEGDNETLSHDMKAIQKQVTEDQKLLRDKINHLSGVAGIQRMESALSETRSKYFQAREKGSPVGSPMTHILTSSSVSSSVDATPTASSGDVTEDIGMPSRVVRSLFREDDSSRDSVSKSSDTSSKLSADQSSSSDEKLVTENELIVNEFLHEQSSGFLDRLNGVLKDENSLEGQIRKTIEKAFWDSIMDSVKQAEPNYDRVVQLVREVRDEITELAPESWKQEIVDAIDLDILSQVLRSGNLDIDYLGKLLDFTLITLQKLSSPAHEDEMKVLHQKLLQELVEECQTRDNSECSHAIAMIKGLQFVLQQIQVLKLEISKARVRMIEPLLKGPAGLDYIRKAFTGRYGSPLDVDVSLPLTKEWLLSVKSCNDEEWAEHKASLSALTNQESSSEAYIPSTTLRTGGNFQNKTNGSKVVTTSTVSSDAAESQRPAPECNGEKLDLLLRLGLLKLVSGIVGLTAETVPETFLLNIARLRLVQSQVQKIIVIATSILVCRQTLLMERMITSSAVMESVLAKCTEQLLELLDRNDEAGIEEIVETIGGFAQDDGKDSHTDAIQSRKLVMARMLAKSLQAGDPIFEKVSRAVYIAFRGVVLGGSGPQGRKLAEMALRQVGAAELLERVVESAKVVEAVASVSLGVHQPWYTKLIENM